MSNSQTPLPTSYSKNESAGRNKNTRSDNFKKRLFSWFFPFCILSRSQHHYNPHSLAFCEALSNGTSFLDSVHHIHPLYQFHKQDFILRIKLCQYFLPAVEEMQQASEVEGKQKADRIDFFVLHQYMRTLLQKQLVRVVVSTSDNHVTTTRIRLFFQYRKRYIVQLLSSKDSSGSRREYEFISKKQPSKGGSERKPLQDQEILKYSLRLCFNDTHHKSYTSIRKKILSFLQDRNWNQYGDTNELTSVSYVHDICDTMYHLLTKYGCWKGKGARINKVLLRGPHPEKNPLHAANFIAPNSSVMFMEHVKWVEQLW